MDTEGTLVKNGEVKNKNSDKEDLDFIQQKSKKNIIIWAPFLHMYQPPWQDIDILKRVDEECYSPLMHMIDRQDNIKITFNVQGCLLEMLHDNGMDHTIAMMKKLVLAGKIELVGSGMFHPIFPLIPKTEISTQIKLQEESLTRFFGPLWERKGFFPPEMAVSPNLAPIVKNHGYQWMIMSGIANNGEWPINYVQQLDCGLLSFYRDDYLSNEISFKSIDATGFVKKIETMYANKGDAYIITGQDAETYGHHIKHYETTFLSHVLSYFAEKNVQWEKAHQNGDKSLVKIDFISNLPKYFPIKPGPSYRASSWSTEYSDLMSNVPFPLWAHPFNPIHKIQYRMLSALYELMEIVEHNLEINRQNKEFMNYYNTARWFYNRALHSCWLWWTSMRPHWSPNLIYKGADLVMKTALNAQLALIRARIGEGNEPYDRIMEYTQKLMSGMIDQELTQNKLSTINLNTEIPPTNAKESKKN